MSITSRAGLLVGLLLAALAVSAPAQAATVNGVVVNHNKRAGSFTVAGKAGNLRAVHAKRSPRIGRKVSVTARKLRNGTFAAKKVKVGARRSKVRIRGTVTQVQRRARRFVVSARGASLSVNGTGPEVGDVVTVDASLDDSGDIEADDVENHGEDDGTIELEGIVLAVDAEKGILTISGDDDGGSGQLTVLLPAGFDSSVYHVGDPVELRATLNPDGTYSAVGSSSDDDVHEADDATDDQGESHDEGDDDHKDPTVAEATATCEAQQADANFAAAHEGKSFTEYYEPEDRMSSFDKCVDENSHGQSHEGSGEDGSSTGSSSSEDGSDS